MASNDVFNDAVVLRSAAAGGFAALVELLIKRKRDEFRNAANETDKGSAAATAQHAITTAQQAIDEAKKATTAADAAKTQHTAFQQNGSVDEENRARDEVIKADQAAKAAGKAANLAVEVLNVVTAAVGKADGDNTHLSDTKAKVQTAQTDVVAANPADDSPDGDLASLVIKASTAASTAKTAGDSAMDAAKKAMEAVTAIPAASGEVADKHIRDEAKRAFDSGFKKYLNDPNTEGCTALYLAASEGHTAVVGLLLNCEGIEHGKQNTKGWSPLRAALSNDHGEPSEILLAHTDGAKMKADRKQNSGWSAICQAASGGQLHVVNLLLRDIAVVGEIDELDADGFSALYLASNGGHARVVKRLIENGAWVNNKNNKGGLTALFAASTAGDAQLVGLLLGKYADPRIRSNEGETPLDAAVSGGHTAVVELLLGALELAKGTKEGTWGDATEIKAKEKRVLMSL